MINFKQHTTAISQLNTFATITESERINAASYLCKITRPKAREIIDRLPDRVRLMIDSYIPNPMLLVEASIFDRTNLTIPRRYDKYAPLLTAKLQDDSAVLRIHPDMVSKYGRELVPVSSIKNRAQLIKFIEGKIPNESKDWPTINTTDGDQIKIYHLQKSGQFREVKQTETSTDIKEGMVSVLFNAIKKRAVTESTKFTKDNLAYKIDKLSKTLDSVAGESQTTLNTIASWLRLQQSKPHSDAVHLLNQTLSQAATIYQQYPNGKLERGDIFTTIRRLGSSITMLPADKWNPGDIYVLMPSALKRLAAAQVQINAESDPARKLQILNDLFVHEWGETNNPIVSISLKLETAQGGKAKDFLKKFAAEKNSYNISKEEQEAPLPQVQQSVLLLRKQLRQRVNNNPSDVEIILKGESKLGDLENNEKRLREKYTALKLVNFLLSISDKLDDAIVSAIGFALSLSGVNPTFFKIVANKDGSASQPQKFAAGGAVTLYPAMDESRCRIYITDNNTSNNIMISCAIEKGETICDAILMARSLGYVQATLELQRITPRAKPD